MTGCSNASFQACSACRGNAMRLTRRRVGVHLLAHQRMAAQLRLQPDLIALARHQPDLHQRGAAQPLHHAVLAQRLLASGVARAGGALNQLLAVPDQVVAPAAGLRGRGGRARSPDRRAPARGAGTALSGARASAPSLANITRPEVSRSMRCTTCGRRFPCDRKCASTSSTSELAWPRRPSGTASSPGGLSTTSSDASSYTTTRSPSRRVRARTARPLPGRSIHTRTTSPSASANAASAVAASRSPTKTFPRSIAAVAFDREPSRPGAARNLSRRPPASAAVTVHCRSDTPPS